VEEDTKNSEEEPKKAEVVTKISDKKMKKQQRNSKSR
jgi:hypothetical protein